MYGAFEVATIVLSPAKGSVVRSRVTGDGVPEPGSNANWLFFLQALAAIVVWGNICIFRDV